MISLTAFAKFEFQNLASILYFISQGFLGATVLVAQTRLFFSAHMPGKTLKLSARSTARLSRLGTSSSVPL